MNVNIRKLKLVAYSSVLVSFWQMSVRDHFPCKETFKSNTHGSHHLHWVQVHSYQLTPGEHNTLSLPDSSSVTTCNQTERTWEGEFENGLKHLLYFPLHRSCFLTPRFNTTVAIGFTHLLLLYNLLAASELMHY